MVKFILKNITTTITISITAILIIIDITLDLLKNNFSLFPLSTYTNDPLLISSILALSISSFFIIPTIIHYYRSTKISESANSDLYKSLKNVLSDLKTNRGESSKIEKIIDEKKKSFLNPSISFHYADHKQIKVFYDITFKEATIESLVSEVTGEASGQIKGSIGTVIEGTLAGTDTRKLVSNIKLPDMSSNEMFYLYQKEAINKSQVILGIEEMEIEETELNEFDELINNLEKKFNLAIDKTILEEHRKKLREKAAEKSLVKLEQVTGWVLIEGKFKIESAKDTFKCIYTHPVSNYLSDRTNLITISALLAKTSLEEHSKGDFEQLAGGPPILLRVYGKVLQPVDRHINRDLKFIPLAVY